MLALDIREHVVRMGIRMPTSQVVGRATEQVSGFLPVKSEKEFYSVHYVATARASCLYLCQENLHAMPAVTKMQYFLKSLMVNENIMSVLRPNQCVK